MVFYRATLLSFPQNLAGSPGNNKIEHGLGFFFRGQQLIIPLDNLQYALFKVDEHSTSMLSCVIINPPGTSIYGWLQDENKVVCTTLVRVNKDKYKYIRRFATFNLATYNVDNIDNTSIDQLDIETLRCHHSNMVLIEYRDSAQIDLLVSINAKNKRFPMTIIGRKEKEQFRGVHWVSPTTFISFGDRGFTDLYFGISFDIYKLQCK
jgi:hypothetical protein